MRHGETECITFLMIWSRPPILLASTSLPLISSSCTSWMYTSIFSYRTYLYTNANININEMTDEPRECNVSMVNALDRSLLFCADSKKDGESVMRWCRGRYRTVRFSLCCYATIIISCTFALLFSVDGEVFFLVSFRFYDCARIKPDIKDKL